MNAQQSLVEPFSQVLLALYRTARESPAEEFQDAALALLEPIFHFESSMWGSGTPSQAGLAVHAIHLREQPLEMIETWQEVNHQDTIAHAVLKRVGWVMNSHHPSLYRERNQLGIRDCVKRFECANSLVAAYKQNEIPLVNWLSLYRRDPDHQFSERERVLFEALLPHIGEALTINRLVNLDRMYTAHEQQRASMAIVDRRGAVHHSDGSFEQTVRIEWPSWDSQTLPPPLVSAMNEVGVGGFRGREIVVEIRRLADLCFLKVRTLRPIDHLSSREREIAHHFGHGLSHKEIARSLGISPTTVRNHVQRIYGKLGVGDKAALSQLISNNR
jgi:DNA-binding CsgD family transcriptional regulator